MRTDMELFTLRLKLLDQVGRIEVLVMQLSFVSSVSVSQLGQVTIRGGLGVIEKLTG